MPGGGRETPGLHVWKFIWTCSTGSWFAWWLLQAGATVPGSGSRRELIHNGGLICDVRYIRAPRLSRPRMYT